MTRKLDGPYSWVVAICCCIVYITNFGFQRAAGVFYVEVMKVFEIKREDAAWPFCVCGAVSSFAGVICGSMVHFFSPRQIISSGVVLCTTSLILCSFAKNIFWLTIFYGILFGFGISAVSPTVPVILNDYFDKYRSTGNGIALAGGSLSFFLLPPLTEYLLEIYDIRGTFMVLSGLTVQTLVAAALLRRRVPLKKRGGDRKPITLEKSVDGCHQEQAVPLVTVVERTETVENTARTVNEDVYFVQEDSQKIEKHRNMQVDINQTQVKRFNVRSLVQVCVMLKEIVTDPMFIIITLSTVITTYIIVTVGIIVVDYGIDRGLTREMAVLLMPVIAVPELLGRLGFGWVADSKFVQRKHLILIVQLLSGLVLFSFTLVKSRILIFCVAASFGIVSSSSLVLFNVLYFDYLGSEKLGPAVGMKSSVAGFAFLLCPRIIGLFRDNVGSYDYLFYLLGCASILSGLAWFLEPCAKRTRQ